MVYGSFLSDRDLPAVQVKISFGETILSPIFILDTGFANDIKVDQQTADDLGIVTQGISRISNANGQVVFGGISPGYADREGKKRPISILIAPGPHLAGMGLFTLFEYKVVVDCKNKTAHLESTI